jgi:hypothetical protein
MTPAQQVRLMMSTRALGTPRYPFVVGVKGVTLPQPRRTDYAIARVAAPSQNYGAALTKTVIVPVVETPGAGTTYSGTMPGSPPPTLKRVTAPFAMMSTANTPRGVSSLPDLADAPVLTATADPAPPKQRKLLVYGGIAAAALGAWWLLR